MGRIDWREVLNWTEEQMDELRLTGFSYIRQGKYDVALPFFEALVVADSAKPYNWQTLGALYLELNMHSKAIETLEHALSMAPSDAATQLNYTKALFTSGEIEKGMDYAHQLKNHPIRKIASFARALILANT